MLDKLSLQTGVSKGWLELGIAIALCLVLGFFLGEPTPKGRKKRKTSSGKGRSGSSRGASRSGSSRGRR